MEESTIQVDEKNNNTTLWSWKVVTHFIISLLFISMGFYKILVYDDGEGLDDPVNAYVGGDAYNFIINSNYATGYFVLALLFAIVGCTLLICNHLSIIIKGNDKDE